MLCQAVLQPGSCFIFRIYRKASCCRREHGFEARQNHICLRSLVLWHPGILRAWCIALPSSGHTDTIFMSSAVRVCQTTTKVGHVDCWLTEGRAGMANGLSPGIGPLFQRVVCSSLLITWDPREGPEYIVLEDLRSWGAPHLCSMVIHAECRLSTPPHPCP